MKYLQQDIILALDIGTNFIKGLVARLTPDHQIQILASTQVSEPQNSVKNGVIISTAGVISACEKTIANLEHLSGETLSQVIISIDGEHIKTYSDHIHFTRSHPTKPITPVELSAIIEKIHFDHAKTSKHALATELSNPRTEITLLNSAISNIHLDSEALISPLTHTGTELIFDLYSSYAAKSQVATIQNIASELNLHLIDIAVAPFAACRTITRIPSTSSPSGIVLDIGDRITSVAIFNSGSILGTTTFAMGVRTAKADPSIWLDGLTICLTEDFHQNSYPSNILLTGGASGSNDIEEALALTDWYKALPFKRRPTISIADLTNLSRIDDPSHVAQNPVFTTALGMLYIASDLRDENNLDTILSPYLSK